MTAPKNNVEENKPDYSELPFRVLAEDTRAYTYGSQVKYYRNSWKEGFSTSNLIRATLSHVIAYYEYGEKYDKEALEAGHKVHHLSMARFNLACIIDGEIRGNGLDDRYAQSSEEDMSPVIRNTDKNITIKDSPKPSCYPFRGEWIRTGCKLTSKKKTSWRDVWKILKKCIRS